MLYPPAGKRRRLYGRLDGRAEVLAARLFPLRREVADSAVANAVAALEAAGLLWRYTVAGREYLQLHGWEKHQKLKWRKAEHPTPQSAAVAGPVQQPPPGCGGNGLWGGCTRPGGGRGRAAGCFAGADGPGAARRKAGQPGGMARRDGAPPHNSGRRRCAAAPHTGLGQAAYSNAGVPTAHTRPPTPAVVP